MGKGWAQEIRDEHSCSDKVSVMCTALTVKHLEQKVRPAEIVKRSLPSAPRLLGLSNQPDWSQSQFGNVAAIFTTLGLNSKDPDEISFSWDDFVPRLFPICNQIDPFS